MTRIIVFTLGLLATCIACGSDTDPEGAVPSAWTLVESSCGYTFMAPPDIVNQDARPFDTCLDFWSTDSCEIHGEVSFLGLPAQYPRVGLIDVQEFTETIDGRTARLITASQNARPEVRFLSNVIFAEFVDDDLVGRVRVTAGCSTEAARDETLTLLRSIDFSEAAQ